MFPVDLSPKGGYQPKISNWARISAATVSRLEQYQPDSNREATSG
jgi:hypothetical protein